jgi:hypothetical protein
VASKKRPRPPIPPPPPIPIRERTGGATFHGEWEEPDSRAEEGSYKILLVAVLPNRGVNRAVFEANFELAESWRPITQASWAICTQEDPGIWAARLAPFVRARGRLFVCRLHPTDMQGWMPEEFWAWWRLHAGS